MTFRRIFTLIYILGLVLSGAAAQELPGRIIRTPLSPVRSPLSMHTSDSFQTGSDVFVGSGTKGSYVLAWKPVNQFSESVTVDNQVMHRDFDYQIDHASGSITFNSPVGTKNVIQVEYSYDPSKAVRNRAPVTLPLTLDLLKKENSALQFTGLYKQSATAAKSAPDLAVYGLTGNTRAKEGTFSSTFLFSPERPGQDGQSEGSFDDRSAIRLGGSTKTDQFELRTSFLRVGEHFAGAEEYKLRQGAEAMDIVAEFTPSDTVSLSSSFKRTEDLASTKKGEVAATTTHKMVVSPDGAPKLTVTRTETEKEKPGASSRQVTSDKLQLEHKIGSSVSAVATHEAISSKAGSSETDSTIDRLVVDAKPTENLSVHASLTQKDGGASGEELAHNVKIVSTPSSDLRLELNVTGRDMESPADESLRTLKLSTTAVKKTKVYLDLAQEESEIEGPQDFGRIRVETSPSTSIKLSGALGQRETADNRELSKEARVEVRPFGHTTIGGGYKEVEANGTVVSRISEIGAATKPVGFVEMSGDYKARETFGQEDLDSLRVALSLDTGRIFKLTGKYMTNPEDRSGVAQRLNSQSIGLKSDFGKLKLKGAFGLKDEYLAGRRAETRELGLDYKLSGNSLLTTSYSLEEYGEASVLETSVYALGYSHRVGSRLNLYLGGRMTTYEKDQLMLQDETEYQAEARLGIRF